MTEITEQKPKRKRVLSKNKTAVAKRKALAKARTEAAKKKKKKKKPVKKPYEYSGRFLPYDRAKKVVKVLELKSRADYMDWHDKNKPDYLPKRPDHAYEKQFENWTLFLSKPEPGTVSKRLLKEKRLSEERKRKEKESLKETQRLKEKVTAVVKHEMKLAQNKANRLKRREQEALQKFKKEKKKIEKRLNTPVAEYVPPGRTKKKTNTKYLPYDQVKRSIHPEKFSTIKEYTAWWEINQPSGIPKRPDRVYPYFKWNDYLGKEDDNRFKKKNYRKIYRTYEEAIRYVRTLGISSSKEWDAFFKSGKCPKDIPRYPHIVYQYRKDDPEWGKWFSWDEWLGKNANQMLEAFREQEKVLMLIVPNGAPRGVYSFVYKKGDQKEIDRFIDDNELYVIRIYKIEIFDWQGYVTRRYQTYQGQANTFIISNIHETLFDLDEHMTRIL